MEQAFNTNKKRLFLVLFFVAVIIVAAGYYLFLRETKNSYFLGAVIEKIEGNMLYVTGTYGFYEKGSSPDNLLFTEPIKDIIIIVDSDTKFSKAMVKLPNLGEGPDIYDPKDLPREIISGSLSDLSGGREINVRSEKNIYGKLKFTASEILYSELIFPNE